MPPRVRPPLEDDATNVLQVILARDVAISERLRLHDVTSSRDERDSAGVLTLVDGVLHIASHALQAGGGKSLQFGRRCDAREKRDAKNADTTDQEGLAPI